jgi:nitrilase
VVCAQSRIDEGAIEKIGLTGQPDKIRVGGGLSGIVAPNATYVAGPHRDEEAIVYGDIDLGMIPYAKFFADSAGHYARPDVFTLSIDGRARTPLSQPDLPLLDAWPIDRAPAEAIEGDGEDDIRLLTPPAAG